MTMKGAPRTEAMRNNKRSWSAKNRSHVNEYKRSYYYAHKERHARNMRESHLKRNYGLTIAAFEQMLKEQDGLCKACTRPLSVDEPRLVHVDHCHKTNVVRGILCYFCNVTLGMVNDDVEHLKKLIAYLESFN